MRKIQKHPKHRLPSGWVSAGVTASHFPLDRFVEAHRRLISLEWMEELGLDIVEALRLALVVGAIGFGELLRRDGRSQLARLAWDSVEPINGGALLTFTDGHRIRVGAFERQILDRLGAMEVEVPVGGIDARALQRVLAHIGSSGLRLDRLRQANILTHLLTHDNAEIGYLLGMQSRALMTAPRLGLGHG